MLSSSTAIGLAGPKSLLNHTGTRAGDVGLEKRTALREH